MSCLATFDASRTFVLPVVELSQGLALISRRSRCLPTVSCLRLRRLVCPLPSTYDEPTVMWRMQRSDGLSAHAVIDLLHGRGVCVMWFLNDRPIGARDFEDWSSAIECSDRLRNQNWTVGWRDAHLPNDKER